MITAMERAEQEMQKRLRKLSVKIMLKFLPFLQLSLTVKLSAQQKSDSLFQKVK